MRKELIEAAERGDLQEVERLIETHNYNRIDYNWAMRGAAWGGHMDIVKLMLDLGADLYNYAMVDAAWGGHMDIVQLMIDSGGNNYNDTMAYAAKGGHMDIVQLMLDLGARDYNWAMVEADRQKDIVDYLKARKRGDTKKAKKIYNEWKLNKFTKRHHDLQKLKHVSHTRKLPEDLERLVAGYMFGRRSRKRRRKNRRRRFGKRSRKRKSRRNRRNRRRSRK